MDGCGQGGCRGVAGNGSGEEAAGDQRAWLRGRLRTGNGCGELRGRLTAADGVGATEWLEMGGEKKPLMMSGEKKPLVMSELGCADSCGWEMASENCADGCGRRGCNGMAGNGGGEEAAGDQRAWLRGRLRAAKGWGELRGERASLRERLRTGMDRRIARTAADSVGAREWLEMGASQIIGSGTRSGTTPIPYPRSIPPFHTCLTDPFHTSVPYL